MDRRLYFNENNWHQPSSADRGPFTNGEGDASELHSSMQCSNISVAPGGLPSSQVNESIGFDTRNSAVDTISNEPPRESTAGNPFSALIECVNAGTFGYDSWDYPFDAYFKSPTSQNAHDDYLPPQQNNTYNNNNDIYNKHCDDVNRQPTMPYDTYGHHNFMSAESYSSPWPSVGDPGNQQLPRSQTQLALQQPQNGYVHEQQMPLPTINPAPTGVGQFGDGSTPNTDFRNHDPSYHNCIALQSTAVTAAATTAVLSSPTERAPGHLRQSTFTDAANELLSFDDGCLPPSLADELVAMMSEHSDGFGSESSTEKYDNRVQQNNTNHGYGNYNVDDSARPAWSQNNYYSVSDYNNSVTGCNQPPSQQPVIVQDQSTQQFRRFESSARRTTSAPLANTSRGDIADGGSSSGHSDITGYYRCSAFDVGVSPHENTAAPTGTKSFVSTSYPCANYGETTAAETLDPTAHSSSPQAVVYRNCYDIENPRTTADGNADSSPSARPVSRDERGPERNEKSVAPVAAAVPLSSVNTSTSIETIDNGPQSNRNDGYSKTITANKSLDQPVQVQSHYHRGVKRHMCNVCGKSFSYPHEWKAHKKTHLEVKVYKCDKCGEPFDKLFLLEAHCFIKHN